MLARSGIRDFEPEMGGEVSPPQSNTSQPGGKRSWLLLKALPRVFRQASSEWINDNCQRLGASVAFYTLLSLAPVVVLAVAVAALVYGQQATQGRLTAEIRGAAGPEVASQIQELVRGAYEPRSGLIATLAGLVTLLFGASSAFMELHDAMNTIWHVSFSRPRDQTKAATAVRLIKDRFYSFATVLSTGFLLLVSVALNAWIAALRISVPPAATFMIWYLVITLVFAALYKLVPSIPLKWSDVALGAMLTALLFMIGKQILGLYFASASFGSAYSAAGSPIVLLLWLYYSAQLFFWGAEFTKVYKQTVESQSARQS
jgi:membrane protein